MISNDFDGKATHLNYFYLHINFEQNYPKPAICICSAWYVGITITYPEEIWCLLSTVTFSDSIAESSLLSSSIWVADCFVASSASAKESSWRNSSSTSWNKVEFEIAVAAAWLRNVFSQDYFFQNFTININTMY